MNARWCSSRSNGNGFKTVAAGGYKVMDHVVEGNPSGFHVASSVAAGSSTALLSMVLPSYTGVFSRERSVIWICTGAFVELS